MRRYFIEDAKCGYDTCFDGCGPHTTLASAIKYKTDDGENRWMYCIHPDGAWPLIGLCDEDYFEEIIRGEFPEGPEYETSSFGGLSWEPGDEYEGLFELFYNNKNNGAANLIHYAYDLCTCTKDRESELLNLGIGKYSDEIDVPILSYEQEWLEEMENE